MRIEFNRTRVAWTVAGVAVLGGLLAPALGLPSSCGGNSAAKGVCKLVGLMAIIESGERDDGRFDLNRLQAVELMELQQICKNRWVTGANFWIRSVPVDTSRKELLVVCDRSYRNVPQRRFGTNEPSFAVGYSDGSVELISVEAFSKLNFDEFARCDKIAL